MGREEGEEEEEEEEEEERRRSMLFPNVFLFSATRAFIFHSVLFPGDCVI